MTNTWGKGLSSKRTAHWKIRIVKIEPISLHILPRTIKRTTFNSQTTNKWMVPDRMQGTFSRGIWIMQGTFKNHQPSKTYLLLIHHIQPMGILLPVKQIICLLFRKSKPFERQCSTICNLKNRIPTTTPFNWSCKIFNYSLGRWVPSTSIVSTRSVTSTSLSSLFTMKAHHATSTRILLILICTWVANRMLAASWR